MFEFFDILLSILVHWFTPRQHNPSCFDFVSTFIKQSPMEEKNHERVLLNTERGVKAVRV